jgi:cytochrome c peroxidase
MMNHERGAQYALSHRLLVQVVSRQRRAARTLALGIVLLAAISSADPLPPSATYRPLPTVPPDVARRNDEAIKPEAMQRQRTLLDERYDLSNQPMPGVMMSGGRKAVQDGVRVKLRAGTSWAELSQMTPDEIKAKDLLPLGFMPLPHPKQSAGGQVFPQRQIDEIQRAEHRDLKRFDIDFDLPDHLTPEFPPPIFLSSRPDLGDVSGGKLLTIRNFYAMLVGVVTPVQMEGLRLLLTPFPQEEFNQTEDRKVAEQSLGVTCLDCHANFHTNAAFHLTPDVRP